MAEIILDDDGREWIDAGGSRRFLSRVPRTARVGAVCPTLDAPAEVGGPGIELLSEDQLEEFTDLEAFVGETSDQKDVGQCAAEGGVGAVRSAYQKAGLEPPDLSPGWLYGSYNGGRDRGSTLTEVLVSLRQRGCCTKKLYPHVWQPNLRRTPEQAAEAQKFKVLEWYDCPSVRHVQTAVMLGFDILIGIFIGNRFRPANDGTLPEWDGANVGGHAMHLGNGIRRRNGRIELLGRNSWTSRWGWEGRYWLPMSYLRPMDGSFADAWAVRVVTGAREDRPPLVRGAAGELQGVAA